VYEFGISAYRNDLGAGFFECFILLCQSSELGCSDKGKVSRIEEQNCPLLRRFLRGEADLAKIALGRLIGFQLKFRGRLSDPNTAAIASHDIVLLCQYRIFKTLIYQNR
jgi:hypothetical protein